MLWRGMLCATYPPSWHLTLCLACPQVQLELREVATAVRLEKLQALRKAIGDTSISPQKREHYQREINELCGEDRKPEVFEYGLMRDGIMVIKAKASLCADMYVCFCTVTHQLMCHRYSC